MVTTFKKQYILIIATIALALSLPLFIKMPYYIHVLTMCLLWAYLASSWNIVGGFAGQLSLGHGIYTAAGAYLAVMLFNTYNLSPWIGMFIGGTGAVLISIIIGYPTFLLRGAYYALATVALASGIVVLIENTPTFLGMTMGAAEGLIVKMAGDAPLYFQFNSKVPYYYIALILLLIVMAVSQWLKNSRLGFYLFALKNDEDAAKALGIDVRIAKLQAAALSAFFTAIGGVFYAMLIRYLEPTAIAGPTMSNQMVFLAIVGGSGTVLGPVLGGISLSLISEIIRNFFGNYLMGLHLFIYGLIVVLVIIFKPQGIIEPLQNLYNRYLGTSQPEEEECHDTNSIGS